jgi:cysteine synthase A
MSRWLLDREGLFLGSSSALNCCAALRLARELGPGKTIVLLLCDSGQRHVTKFWNDDVMREKGFDPRIPATAADLVDALAAAAAATAV